MTTPQFDVAIVIGRFAPVHKGHGTLFRHALEAAAKVVVVLGSARRARDAKNPFNWEERAAMIHLTLTETERGRVSFLPMRDYYDDVRWQATVVAGVKEQTDSDDARVVLVGFEKDASSYYLNLFPRWEWLPATREHSTDATDVRRMMFECNDVEARDSLIAGATHPKVAAYISTWLRQGFVPALRAEHAAVERAKAAWRNAPYPPIFSTTDAVVVASGHVLLIRRGNAIGKGLWALPGGFLEPHERLLHGAIRELREETGLGTHTLTLQHALKGVAVFDHPARSLRGRTITHAHYFDLRDARPPEVQAADDAAHAQWVPLEALPGMEEQFFEDHYAILDHFLGIAV